jgi:hypothetical protein
MSVSDPAGNLLAPVSYYPDDNLAAAITRAWTDPGFKDRLRERDYTTPSAALAEMGITVPRPVVLTPKEYYAGYKKQSADEVILVLPDPPADPVARYLPDRVKSAMKFTPFGM